ncbi:MAG: 4-hydroxy-3-methylbut-2-enyl diphosphate reductase [Planctomycetes bacterium]|nr:4-hydroxy-3-methylbut-2-enyl diphosphate reductase [Planctomycetota bacterium]
MADYHRKYFGLKKEVAPVLEATYASKIVDLLRLKGFQVTREGMTIKLAKEFGFCVGVERAVQMAYETRRKFPDKRLFITAEIIHNAYVNKQLVEMGVIFLNGQYANGMTWNDIGADDVVILPAFGAAVKEVEMVKQKGAFIVDTTCGAVVNVWNNVQKYAKDTFTSVIHGKYSHEETLATASRATGDADGFTGQRLAQQGKYIIVRDLDEAQLVCDYILGKSKLDHDAFFKRFAPAVSEGFDPDKDLELIGVANQTTMLSSETLAIQALLKNTFIQKYGPAETAQRFRSIDTICSATQDRQDAVKDMLVAKPDVTIVIGGYNSSNTTHLAEMGIEKGVPTYHIDDAACMMNKTQIRHQPIGKHEEVVAEDWWPKRSPFTVAVTAGASTPNNKIGDIFMRLFELHGCNVDDLIEELDALPTPELTPEERARMERQRLEHEQHHNN